jgi:hypothetical protein
MLAAVLLGWILGVGAVIAGVEIATRLKRPN